MYTLSPWACGPWASGVHIKQTTRVHGITITHTHTHTHIYIYIYVATQCIIFIIVYNYSGWLAIHILGIHICTFNIFDYAET